MGFITTLLKYGIRYGVPLFIGIMVTLNLVVFLAFPVRINPSMPSWLRLIGVGTPLVCIVGSAIGYWWKRDMRVFIIGVPTAIATPWAVLALSWVLLIPQVIAGFTLTEQVFFVAIPTFVAIFLIEYVLTRRSGSSSKSATRQGVTYEASTASKGEVLAGGFQVVESPQERILHDERNGQHDFWSPSTCVLRSMMGEDVPLIYRFERVHGAIHEYYLTLGNGSNDLRRNMNLLERALGANLNNYRFEKAKKLQPPPITSHDKGVAICLTGEPLMADDPRQRADPLTVAAEAMLRYERAVLQVSAMPASSGVLRTIKRVWLGMEYKTKSSQAQVTVTREKGGLFSRGAQESTVLVDPIATSKANRTHRELERHRATDACEVEVAIACWGRDVLQAEGNARHLMVTLRGAVNPVDPSTDLRLRVRKKRADFLRLLHGRPIGEFTLLLPSEAAHLFTLPQTDVATPIAKRSAFSTHTDPLPDSAEMTNSQLGRPSSYSKAEAPQEVGGVEWRHTQRNRAGVIFLGNPLRANGEPIAGSLVYFTFQKFESHFGVFGNTRSGKTWTAFMIVAQAMRLGIKSTIVVPRKSRDWTRLLHLFPDIWVFTPGDLDTAPLRINLFSPPRNVPLTIWMDTVVQMLSGLLPSDRVMSLHFKDVVHTAYRNCGWSAKEKRQGRPILLSDLYEAMEEVSLNLDYGNELKANFYGALFSRIASMLRNHTVVDMYNTEEGITWEQLAENNVIIDMERLPNEDRAFLMGLISAGLHRYKMFNPSKRITNLLVLEEASYVLKPSRVQDLYGPDASDTLLSLMTDMFTTCGGNGLGTLTIEQLPSRLASEIVKLIVNVISHAVGDESDRRIVGSHIGVEEARIDHLQQMRVGETLVYLEGSGVPRNVQIWPIDTLLEGRLSERPVTSEQVQKHMEPVFEEYENLRSTVDLPSNIITRIERSGPVGSGVLPRATPSGQSESLGARSLRETQAYYNEKIREFVCDPLFLESLEMRRGSAVGDDVGPLVDMIVMVSEELAGRDLEQAWVAERLAVHSAEIYPDSLGRDTLDAVLGRLGELRAKGG
ncbi:MAG: ATP-binding protein [Candidatus Thorarchaeota archaeon]